MRIGAAFLFAALLFAIVAHYERRIKQLESSPAVRIVAVPRSQYNDVFVSTHASVSDPDSSMSGAG